MRNSIGATLAMLILASIPVWYAIAVLNTGATVPAPSRTSDWQATPSRDAQVMRAARFALAEQTRLTQLPLRLLAIKHVRQQQLPDLQYSMNLLVLREGVRHLVIADVVTRPDGSMELTRWHWV